MLYTLLKYSISFGLHAFHKKIEYHGVQNIPKDKPLLFLPNHQNALIDVLLIATYCNRTPYFLARSDVFKKPILRTFFSYLKMIPVYRVRDGRDTVTRNHEIFDNCAQLLIKREAVTMFPEANHNLKRRVRTLSKGFTRVIFKALETSPELDILVVPVGLNYQHARLFPDSAAVYYGEPIAIKELYDSKDLVRSALNIRNEVEASLRRLTTHVEPESNYEEIIEQLELRKTNFLNPVAVNRVVKNWNQNTGVVTKEVKTFKSFLNKLLYPIFMTVNMPVLLIWKLVLKPKVWEDEFMGTLRFATALIGFLLYLPMLFALVYVVSDGIWAFGTLVFLLAFNWMYVKHFANA